MNAFCLWFQNDVSMWYSFSEKYKLVSLALSPLCLQIQLCVAQLWNFFKEKNKTNRLKLSVVKKKKCILKRSIKFYMTDIYISLYFLWLRYGIGIVFLVCPSYASWCFSLLFCASVPPILLWILNGSWCFEDVCSYKKSGNKYLKEKKKPTL